MPWLTRTIHELFGLKEIFSFTGCCNYKVTDSGYCRNMASDRIIQSLPTLVLASVLILVSFSKVRANDDRYDEFPSAERFNFRIGGFLIDSFDTTVRFDSTQFPLGSLIDLEDNFDVDSSESVLRIDGFYRFNHRHRIDWTYYRSRRKGSSVATQDYIIGDPDDPLGGFIIPRDSNVQTVWNFDLLKIGYAWSFLNKRRYEMFIGTGLSIRELEIEIAYQSSLDGISRFDSFEAGPTIPLPTAVIGGRWNFTEKWQGIFRYEFFLLEVGNYKGSQQDFQLLLEHSTFKHVGFGVGINTVHINLRARDDTLRGEFDSRILGLLGYTKVYF